MLPLEEAWLPAAVFAAAGVTLVILVAKSATGLSPSATKAVIAASMILNLIAVETPGRLDQAYTQAGVLSPLTGRTLVAPEGWAFAIWGPIFLGETTFCALQMFAPEDSKVTATNMEFVSGWASACVAQALWCASFRPIFAQSGQIWVAAVFLALTPVCLSRAHAAFTVQNDSKREAITYLPFAMHFGWTSAAALINVNAVVAYSSAGAGVIAAVGHLSILPALVLGVFVAFRRNAPVYAFVLAWALAAVADGMRTRVAYAVDPGAAGVVGAAFQANLAAISSVCCALAGVSVTARLASKRARRCRRVPSAPEINLLTA
jgi:hypothetical protein